MALLKIARMGHPVLRARAAEIDDPKAPWVRQLVEDMIETMEDAGGTGIAAPQVHEGRRIVVFRVDGDRLSDLPGYEDWYLLDGTWAMDPLNAFAISGHVQAPHDSVAAMMEQWHGGLYAHAGGAT